MQSPDPAPKAPAKPAPGPNRPPKPVRFTDWAQI